MTPSRDKGTRAETAVVDWLKANGWPFVERHAQHGSKDVGDINGIGAVIEVKSASRIDLSGWIAELEHEMFTADSGDGVVFVKRRGTTDVGEWYAIQTVAMWAEMAKEAGL